MASKELTELSIQLAPKSESSKYKVKKGDTLSGIASQLGVGMDSISGYRSGNKDLIYPGEELSVGAPKKTESSSYVDEVKTQLNENDTEESDDPYGLGKVRLDIEETTKKRDDAFAELKDISTKTFEDEYKSRKLEEKKQKMSLLDGDIASKKSERDAAIAKVRANPGLSAAQMTGDIKKMSDYANNEINNLIAERNGVAGEYNNELEEIDRLVTNTVKDKSLEYGYYDDVLKDLTGQVSEYSKTMREQLQDERQADQFDRQLAQALEIATMNANKKGSDSSNLQLKSDPNTGDPLYWFDTETGDITYVNDEDTPDAGGDSFEDIPEPENKDEGTPWYKRLWGAITGK